jgi:DNA transformation protein
MTVSADYLQYVLGQLSGLGGLRTRRMFGAVGLYQEDRFFGIITNDTLYFKVNDANRDDYASRGMSQFRPYPDKPDVSSKPNVSMGYYELPADTLEDPDECIAWARKSVAASGARKSKPPSPKLKPRSRKPKPPSLQKR